MTSEEAKKCLMTRQEVMCNGLNYERISAIIYRLDERDNIVISAELLDKNRNSVTVAQLKDVKEKTANE